MSYNFHLHQRVTRFFTAFFLFFVFLIFTHIAVPTAAAQSATCPQSHPYLCDGIGPSGEEVCSTEVDCSSNNITVGSTSGPDCRENPGYCETLSPSCPSGSGGSVTCNQDTGWCETLSCSEGLDPSSQRYESNRQIYETRSNPIDIVIGEPGNSSSPVINMLDWNRQINSRLEQGLWAYFNRMVNPISNNGYSTVVREGQVENTAREGLYWCTNSIIDSYQLSGRGGLGDNHQGVVSMRNYWKTAQGYDYVEYHQGNKQSALSSIGPGYAIFMESVPGIHTGREHVAMVEEVVLNSQGDGHLRTIDSNSSARGHKFPVSGWVIQNTPYPVMGFGG